MRMNCDRLMGEIKPYEILVRYRDKYGAGDYSAWGNWRFSSAHQTESGRDDAYLKLHDSDIKQYKPHLNEFEYKAQLARMGHKPDETDIAGALADPSISGSFKESTGVDPDDGVLALKYAAGLFDIAAEEDPMVADCYQRALRGEAGYIQYTIDQEYNVKVRWIEL